MPALIRPARSTDSAALCRISLATGHEGGDAAALYRDPGLMGLIYAVPYLHGPDAICLVAEDATGVAGFALGTRDTPRFEAWMERVWWPPLRERYPDQPADARATWTADARRCHMIHHPAGTPAAVTADYPAHLHLNLLPRLQGRGLGLRMVEGWLAAAGAMAVHVGVNARNAGALAFWPRCGFAPLAVPLPAGRTVWLGRRGG